MNQHEMKIDHKMYYVLFLLCTVFLFHKIPVLFSSFPVLLNLTNGYYYFYKFYYYLLYAIYLYLKNIYMFNIQLENIGTFK